MNRKTKTRMRIFSFLITCCVFITGGIEMLGEHKPFFALVQFIAGTCNFLVVFLNRKLTLKLLFEYLILILNVFAAITVSVYYFSIGSNYIQYAWILVAILSVIAIIITARRKNRSDLAQDVGLAE